MIMQIFPTLTPYTPTRSSQMRRTVLLLVVVAALLGTSSAAGPSTEDKKKAIRMKSTPKLKEILADLGIEHDTSIGKEELRELVLQEDALTKWEKKHPGQKKVLAYCFATAWPQHVHRMCLCIHNVHTVYALHMHCKCDGLCTACAALHAHARGAHTAMHTTLHTPCMHTAGAQQSSRRLRQRRRRRWDGRHVLYDDGQGQGRYASK